MSKINKITESGDYIARYIVKNKLDLITYVELGYKIFCSDEIIFLDNSSETIANIHPKLFYSDKIYALLNHEQFIDECSFYYNNQEIIDYLLDNLFIVEEKGSAIFLKKCLDNLLNK